MPYFGKRINAAKNSLRNAKKMLSTRRDAESLYKVQNAEKNLKKLLRFRALTLGTTAAATAGTVVSLKNRKKKG